MAAIGYPFQHAHRAVSTFVIGFFLLAAGQPGLPVPLTRSSAESPSTVSFSTRDARPLPVPPGSGQTAFTQLDLYPNIETIGVAVSGAGLPERADLSYRPSGSADWQAGHPLLRIKDGRLVGSLFGLSPGTLYEVRVMDGANEISGAATTQPQDLQFTPASVLHVDDSASPGGDGSAASPFQTIQEGVNRATPGTQVLVADGLYRESVTFPASGAPGNWIQVKAAGGGAILDGSETLSGDIWTPHDQARVWFTKLSGPIGYLARDQKRFYMYDDLRGLLNASGHNNVPINEGWFFERGTLKLYVRSMDNPALHTWQAPRFNQAFEASGQDWLWIEGFEMGFYGAQTGGCGVCATDVSHLVIRKNRIHHIRWGIYINWTGGEERGNDTRIEFNELYDTAAASWPWSAVKGSTMDGIAVLLRGHRGAIVRGNELHHFFNGIYSGSSGDPGNTGIALDADIYDNRIYNITDDAFEPEGACLNNRFRNNTVDGSFVGVSLAPVTQGPVWVLRSSFASYTGRGIKWDKGSDGIVLVYHNTFWTPFPNVNAMEMISPVHNATLRNNIFQGDGYSVYEVQTGSTDHDWNYDNWSATPSVHFKWENKDYGSIAALCAATGLECNGHESLPEFSNPSVGDFTLLPSSPNIDRGVVIPGITGAFTGSAPDIGRFEHASAIDAAPVVASITRAGANPTSTASVNFTLTFSESVTGVDTSPPFSDFVLSTDTGITGASVTGVAPVSGTTYTVSVNTGSGSGTLRLDVLDDNTIMDAAGTPLGGVNQGDGSFSSGESYTVEKSEPSVPRVTGSLRADPNPIAADIVSFNVTFSEPVSGVDIADFTLMTTGGLSGALVASVSGSGSSYTVLVGTGSGDGGLRLDILDDGSIVSASGAALGGAGTGNGGFTAGEAYMIDKTVPRVTGSARAGPNPTAAASVNFTVVFSEPVTGVEGGDFFLAASGSITGAAVSGVSGSGYLYTVSALTGTGDGALRLEVLDDDSIRDAAGLPLGGTGIGNGNFSIGEEYSVQRSVGSTITETFRSNGRNDGWVLESGEDTNRGGSLNAKSAIFVLGDDKGDRQYRAILDFPTEALPDNVVITKAMVLIKGEGLVGTNPFLTHQNILVDIRSGSFGGFLLFMNRGLQTVDFQGVSSRDSAGVILNNPYYGWYWTHLDSSSFQYINVRGITQLRLRFQVDDNDDRGNNYIRFFSGDAGNQADRPQLVIEYYQR